VFAGIGLFALIRGSVHYRTGKASATWPAVEGQVVVATVDKSDSTDSDGMTTRRYSPRVVYSYTIGANNTAAIRSVGTWTYPSHARDAAKLKHQTGQRVSVYYNPDNPAQAVLEPGSTRGAWGTLLIGIVFFAGDIAVTIFNM